MKRFKLLLIAVFLIGPFVAEAQYYEPEKKEKAEQVKEKSIIDRIHFGGSLSMQFGSYTSIYVSPIAYYDVTNKLMLGAGFNYIYQKYDNIYTNQEVKTSIYGPKLGAILKPFQQLIISSEFEYNYYNYNESIITPYWHGTWYVGLGYGVPIGKNGGMYLSMSYDLLYDESLSYYSSPWRPTVGVYF